MADTEWTTMQTAIGMVIDILMDNLVGHDDAADPGDMVTDQSAVDMKKALQDVIATAHEFHFHFSFAPTILSCSGMVIAQGTYNLVHLSLSSECCALCWSHDMLNMLTPAVNMAANAALLNGSLTLINLGNTGVGTFQTNVIDVLLNKTCYLMVILTSGSTVLTLLLQFWLSVGPPVGKSPGYPMISLIRYATCLLHPGVLSMISLHWMWASHKYYSEVGSSQADIILKSGPHFFKMLWKHPR
ncbi:hypothetical protein B0H10DRAFT_1944245 [Mycena sp. CBHHK59/15]|nr:hypothetical protein B0H10DRAFT_1944245 [Mycena sp. CBHHK59/15]